MCAHQKGHGSLGNPGPDVRVCHRRRGEASGDLLGETSRRQWQSHVSPTATLTGLSGAPTLTGMEVHLTPEQQHQLAELAAQRGRDANALALEAISRYLADEVRFIDAVKLGEAALERGEYLTHEQVGERLNRLFRS
jgi:predicted transcriptional regulator